MISKEKIIFTFNQFYITLIKELKEKDPFIRSNIKKNYKTFDKLSSNYTTFFWESIHDIFDTIVEKSCDSLSLDKTIGDFTPIKNLTWSTINDKLSPNEKPIFYNYIFILTIFSKIIVDSGDEPDKEIEALYNKAVEVITNVEKGVDSKEIIEEVLDDDTKKLLEKIKFNPKSSDEKISSSSSTKNENGNPENIFKNMEASKIVNLAKEISEGIDVSNLKIDKPEDVFGMMNGSNNMLGDIIQKVSSTVSGKINSGELNQNDLMQEACNMMASLKGGGGEMGGMGDILNNPMFSSILKNMGGKGKKPQMRNTGRSTDTRERLRKKLEDRKNNE